MTRQFTIKLSVICVVQMILSVVVGLGLAKSAMSVSWKIVSVLGLLVLAFGFSLWFMNRLLEPVQDAQRVAEKLLSLFGTQTPRQETKEEVKGLRSTLTELSDCVQERLHALEEERAKVTTILDSMVEGVMALDKQGRVVVINPSARRILDLAQEEVETRSLLEVVRNGILPISSSNANYSRILNVLNGKWF